MKKSLCVSKNNQQPSNKLSLLSSAATPTFSAGIKVAITSLIVIIFSAPINEAAVIQAVIEIDGSPENFVKIILQKMDHLIEAKKNAANQVHNSSDTVTHYDIASSTLMSIGSEAFSIGRTFTIRGNITDNKKNSKPVIRFQIYAEATNRTIESTGIRPFDDDSVDDEDNNNDYNRCTKIKENEYQSDYEQDDYYYYASNGGILEPIVKTVEPYVLTLLNIIFHGIMTSIISKIMDNANLSGDVRLV